MTQLVGALLGDQSFQDFRYYKPSQYDEAFLGFDQGWAKTPNLSREEFLKRLKNALLAGASNVDGVYHHAIPASACPQRAASTASEVRHAIAGCPAAPLLRQVGLVRSARSWIARV